MFRTGSLLAAHHFGVEPDLVILAKALSGGLVPSGAVLMSDAVLRLGLYLVQTLDRPHLNPQR
jgi:acetylornithine/succinyldiaminopimelate/putrescine aminotransferase